MINMNDPNYYQSPCCDRCGRSLKGFYAYQTPDDEVLCELCVDDYLYDLKREMEYCPDEDAYGDYADSIANERMNEGR